VIPAPRHPLETLEGLRVETGETVHEMREEERETARRLEEEKHGR